MRTGDVILEVNHHKVYSVAEVSGFLDDLSPSDVVLFMVMRGGITNFVGLQAP